MNREQLNKLIASHKKHIESLETELKNCKEIDQLTSKNLNDSIESSKSLITGLESMLKG